jgi:DNA-binding YbaB/EbfC family protein
MKGFPGNIKDVMQQMKKVKKELEEKQAELEQMKVEATSGGGMVKVVANGKEEILDIEIDQEVVDPNDVEMLEDLILAAIKEVQGKVKELVKKEIGGLAGGLNLPDIPGL